MEAFNHVHRKKERENLSGENIRGGGASIASDTSEEIIHDDARRCRMEQRAPTIQQEREQLDQQIREWVGSALHHIGRQVQMIADLVQNSQHDQAIETLERTVGMTYHPRPDGIEHSQPQLVATAHEDRRDTTTSSLPTVPPAAVRVFLVDDSIPFLYALEKVLTIFGFQVVGTATDGNTAIERVLALKPDIVLMDIQVPGCDGLTATKIIKGELPETKVVMLSLFDHEAYLFDAIKHGASGYLLKGMDGNKLAQKLLDLTDGEVVFSPGLAQRVLDELCRCKSTAPSPTPPAFLTETQTRLLSLLAQGLKQHEIAQEMGYTERTIRRHIQDILKQLQFTSRAEVIRYARDHLARGTWSQAG